MPDRRLTRKGSLVTVRLVMKTIGLTGNIAAGKSTVLGILRDLGAATIDADAVVHAQYAVGSAVFQRTIEAFGHEILQANGEIDRAALGAIVFADPTRLRQLERIVHPAVQAAVEAWWNEQRHQSELTGRPPVAVIDAVKLLESPSLRFCDQVWVVVAPVEEQLRRLIENRGMSAAQARDRLSRQPDPAGRLARADVVIQNGGSIDRTREQVVAAWDALLADETDSAAREVASTPDPNGHRIE